MTSSPAAPAAWHEFRARRESGLSDPHGILAQVALHWIDPRAGAQAVEGLPGTWGLVGDRLEAAWEGDALQLLTEEVELSADGERRRAVLRTDGDVRLAEVGGSVRIDVIRRGGRTGLRVLDPSTPRRTGFTGVPTFPYDPALVLTGRWREERGEVTVGSALPWLSQHLPASGTVTLDLDGTAVELLVTGSASLLFTDETSGSESADWRVVGVEVDGDTARIDLNRAVNFPAAFSAWATCPRPPAGNHLPIAVRAGERRVERTTA